MDLMRLDRFTRQSAHAWHLDTLEHAPRPNDWSLLTKIRRSRTVRTGIAAVQDRAVAEDRVPAAGNPREEP